MRTVVEGLDRYWCSGQAAERRAWKPYAAEVAAYTRPLIEHPARRGGGRPDGDTEGLSIVDGQ